MTVPHVRSDRNVGPPDPEESRPRRGLKDLRPISQTLSARLDVLPAEILNHIFDYVPFYGAVSCITSWPSRINCCIIHHIHHGKVFGCFETAETLAASREPFMLMLQLDDYIDKGVWARRMRDLSKEVRRQIYNFPTHRCFLGSFNHRLIRLNELWIKYRLGLSDFDSQSRWADVRLRYKEHPFDWISIQAESEDFRNIYSSDLLQSLYKDITTFLTKVLSGQVRLNKSGFTVEETQRIQVALYNTKRIFRNHLNRYCPLKRDMTAREYESAILETAWNQYNSNRREMECNVRKTLQDLTSRTFRLEKNYGSLGCSDVTVANMEEIVSISIVGESMCDAVATRVIDDTESRIQQVFAELPLDVFHSFRRFFDKNHVISSDRYSAGRTERFWLCRLQHSVLQIKYDQLIRVADIWDRYAGMLIWWDQVQKVPDNVAHISRNMRAETALIKRPAFNGKKRYPIHKAKSLLEAPGLPILPRDEELNFFLRCMHAHPPSDQACEAAMRDVERHSLLGLLPRDMPEHDYPKEVNQTLACALSGLVSIYRCGRDSPVPRIIHSNEPLEGSFTKFDWREESQRSTWQDPLDDRDIEWIEAFLESCIALKKEFPADAP